MKQINWAAMIPPQVEVVSCVVGAPGEAKTATIKALAEHSGRRFIAFHLNQELPEDLGGYKAMAEAIVAGQSHRVMASFPDERRLAADLEPTVVLLDEIYGVPHSVQAAALKWMNEPGTHCWMFAAGNPAELAAGSTDLTSPVINRVCLLDWEQNDQAIHAGLRNGLVFPAPDVPLVPASWRDCNLPKWGLVVSEFLTLHPDFIRLDKAVGTDKYMQPFPSPRAWTNAAKCLAAGEAVAASRMTLGKMVHGLVGETHGMAFMQWLETQDMPDPDAVLDNPAILKLPIRGDLAIAILKSILGRIEATGTPERWERGCDVWERAYTQSQEITMAAFGHLWKCKPTEHAPITRNGTWKEMCALRAGA